MSCPTCQTPLTAFTRAYADTLTEEQRREVWSTVAFMVYLGAEPVLFCEACVLGGEK